MPELHAGSERRIAGLHKLSAVSGCDRNCLLTERRGGCIIRRCLCSDTASRGGSVPPEFVAGEGFPGSAGAGTTASGTGGSSRTRVVKGFGTTVREPSPRCPPPAPRCHSGAHAPPKHNIQREGFLPLLHAARRGRRPISQGSPRCTDWHRKGLVLPCPEKGFPRTAPARVQMPPASAPFRRFLPSPEDKCPPGVLLAHPASGGAHDTRRLLNIQRCS